jgi:curved DNA-binding protein CbpA
LKDYYRILGLEAFCEQEMIKQKYRELVKKYHPDLAKNEEENKEFTSSIIAINEAYGVLSNSNSRAHYDNLYAIYFRKTNEHALVYQSFHVMDMISVTLDAWTSMIAYLLDEVAADSRDDDKKEPSPNDSDSDLYHVAPPGSVDEYESDCVE